MKQWFSASELAGLPGLPTSERGVRFAAERSSWTSRQRAGRGGGAEYSVESLPDESRVELARRALPLAPVVAQFKAGTESASSSPAAAAMLLGQNLVGAQAQRADARLAVVQACDAFIRAAHLSVTAGTRTFCDLYNAKKIDGLDEATISAVAHVTPNSLNAWRKKLATEGTAALAGRYGQHRKGAGKIDTNPDARDLIIGVIAHQPHATAAHVMQALRERLPRNQVPAYRTVQRFMKSWKEENAGIFAFHSNPDAWKGQARVAFGNANVIDRLNQVWEMDATPADVMLKDGRHAVVGVIDVYSRRVKLLVTKTSRTVAVLAVMRRAMLDWGVPEIVKTDNGKDFASAHMKRALADLGIEHKLCPPFTPESKPHIERFFGTLTRNLFEQLPGYIGHDVAGRKAIEARKTFAQRMAGETQEISMTADELQAACDSWSESLYSHEAHGGLKGKSPFEIAAAWMAPVRRIDDERQLDVLLAEAPGTSGLRVVGKKGIELDGTFFIGAELGAYVGRRVHVRYDAADMGRVFVFDADQGMSFIGIAVAPERAGIDPREIAAIARQKQKQIVLEGRRELKRIARNVNAKNIINEVLGTATESAAGVVSFPRKGEALDTPALAEAAAAIGKSRPASSIFGPATFSDLTDEQKAEADALFEKIEGNRKARPTLAVVNDSSDRPIFPDDVSYARWVQANPTRATDADRRQLEALLADPNFRLLMEWSENDEAAAG